MTGLSVAVAFRTGLFNIGAPGQYLMGTTATLYIALTIPTETVPAWIVWILAFAGGMLAGAIWGCIPGILKAYLNINEVITCIMTNWIAANLVTWFFDVRDELKNAEEGGKVGYIKPTSSNGVETFDFGLDKLFPGSQVSGGIIIAILIAIVVYIVMTKTTFGYQLKACGSNRHAARYAGIMINLALLLPWPSQELFQLQEHLCTTWQAIRSSSGPLIRCFLTRALTAYRLRSWLPIIL